jgi:hypothetical protein
MSDLFPVEVDVILSVLSARFTPKSLETCELVLQEASFEHNEAATVVAFIARRCHNLQQHLTRGFAEGDIQYLAWAARTLFELKVFSEFVMQSDENRKRFIKDAFVDASSAMQVAYQTVATLLDEQTKIEGQKLLEQIKPDLTAKLENAGVTPSDKYLHVAALAKNLGIEAEYRIVNMLLSKFTHTTGLSVILPFETEKKVATARESFLLLGAMNALHTINRLSDYAHTHGLPPLDN